MRVVIAEDSLFMREGLRTVLADCGIDVVAGCADAAELLVAVAEAKPDAAVIDVRMPPTHTTEGISAAERILADHPGTAVLVLSQYIEPHYAMRLLDERPDGVGYLLKERVFDGVLLLDALQRLTSGESIVDPSIVHELMEARRHSTLPQLSERERQVLSLVAQGLSNRAIADQLFIAERTVEAHITRILPKLGLREGPDVHRRVLAALAFVEGSRE